MSHFVITGGVPLEGTIRAGGSKNAALPMMAASLLADGPIHLERVPRLTDVRMMSLLLRDLGMAVSRTADGLRMELTDSDPVRAGYKLLRRMRAGFCVLGPLLARRGRAVISLPGGCNLGDRPVDLHLRGLAALGADIRLERGYIVASSRRLIGTTIDLRGRMGPTVTGTANVLSAAVLAQGTTTILGAAQEPEIVDLGHFLKSLGARIEGLGTSVLEIRGVDQLGETTYRIIPDRIEAATLLLATAITCGSVTVTDVKPDHLDLFLRMLESAGARIDRGADTITLRMEAPPRGVDYIAEPYPGMPTDLQAQWTAFMSIADGPSVVEDRVFPARFGHVAELNRLGANIECHGARARIAGMARLEAAEVRASDLRASAALVLAGLVARGNTVVHCVEHLDRGYERVDRKLRALGARIHGGSAAVIARNRG